ncbi:hypothetical protein [Nocardioides conyzicola]|uniref:Uncharacterized protein n=1 Tax=Nocardioides conyzicola TaxID=1651781 RepID=A0ABP8Y5T3_9ACTN
MKLGNSVATVLAAALAVGLLAGPASAEKVRYGDPADTTGSLTDIRAVTPDHRTTRLVVKVGFTDLRRRSTGGPAGLTIAIDTRADRAGAEYRLSTGLQAGMDYQLMRVRHGKVVGEPLTCPHQVRLDYAADRLTLATARTCIGSPESIRIGVKMRDDWDASHPMVDWLGAPRSYTAWLVSS